jgi:glyoxylase-like metal-dependent hydrolase (beta-lactamase superfamily II)
MAIPHTFILPKNNAFAPRCYGELKKVTERIYIIRNITNSSFIIGDRSVAVIDTQVNLPSAEEFLRLLRSVTDKPIEYVINTHYHWDHTNGNALFKKEGATVVSSQLTKEFMISRAERQKEFLAGRGFELGNDPFLPERTFEGSLELDLGNMPLRLFFAGTAETDDATAIHVVKENVVMSGDTVMTGSFPIFGQPVWDEGLQDDQWMRTIEKIISLKPAHIVPGHGELAHQAEIDWLIRIQKYFLDEVAARVKKGMDLKPLLEDLERQLPPWITEIPVVWGTPRYAILRVYRALTKKNSDREPGWQQFKPSVIPDPKKTFKVPEGETIQSFLSMASEAGEGGDLGLKIAILKKATQVFSNSCEAFTVYADALVEASRGERSVLEKGDYFEGARHAWDKAMALDPANASTLLGKGRYLTLMAYRGGDDPRAGMKLLEKVIELSCGGRLQAEAEFYLGMGYRRLSEEAKAHAQFQKALALDASFLPAALATRL